MKIGIVGYQGSGKSSLPNPQMDRGLAHFSARCGKNYSQRLH